ncbi:MAG TPA: chloride channel protein [Terracidiphilus sp.]|nr:chloride channel protein [Terracidiphilus sp.]
MGIQLSMPGTKPVVQPRENEVVLGPRLGLLILLTGAGAGLTSGLLMKLLRLVQHFFFHYRQGDFLSGVEGVSNAHRVIVLACAGILAGLVLLAVQRIRDHRGPGLNDAIREHAGELPERSLTVKAILSIVVVGMGAAIGREASLKEAGALVGKKLADLTRLTAGERRLLVACGAGAGMAAAYNVPLGGALFVLEVLLETVSVSAVLAAFATSFLATAVSWLMLPNLPTYQFPELPMTGSLLLWALIAGPLLGMASIVFVRGIEWSKEHKPQGWRVAVLPVVVFTMLGALAIPFPQLLGNGRNVVQLAFDEKMSVALLGWLLVLRPLATMLVLRAGVPGGLFTPTMTFGALSGALLGEAWNHLAHAVDERGAVLLGTGAVLAACTQAPISSVVFMLELTGRAGSLIAPLLIAVCGAVWIFRQFETKTTY